MVRSAMKLPDTAMRSSCAAAASFASARCVCQLPRAMPAAQPAAARTSVQPRGRKEYPRSMLRYFVIGVFVLIVASLASALVFMYRDKGGSTRVLKALALRVGLSVA